MCDKGKHSVCPGFPIPPLTGCVNLGLGELFTLYMSHFPLSVKWGHTSSTYFVVMRYLCIVIYKVLRIDLARGKYHDKIHYYDDDPSIGVILNNCKIRSVCDNTKLSFPRVAN